MLVHLVNQNTRSNSTKNKTASLNNGTNMGTGTTLTWGSAQAFKRNVHGSKSLSIDREAGHNRPDEMIPNGSLEVSCINHLIIVSLKSVHFILAQSWTSIEFRPLSF